MLLIFWLQIVFSLRYSSAIRTDFLLDFLAARHSKSVVFFLCDFDEIHKTFTAVNERNIAVQFVNIDGSREVIPSAILPRTNYARTVCVYDYSCAKSLQILQKFSDLKYFNTTYSWLFVADNDSTVDVNDILWQLKFIQMNSDLITVQKENNGTKFDLIDVYTRGRHLCKDILQAKYGEWQEKKGMQLVSGSGRYYLRGNFEGLQLRGVTVIDRDNVTSDDVDRILSEPRKGQGSVAFVKYHYALLGILRQYHNFTVKYRLSRSWSGRLKSGYRLGLLGILSRNEADVATTGIFQRVNRHAEFDSIHLSWEFEARFIYRITPQLSDASGGGNFFTPFDRNVWIASSIIMVIVLVVLKLVTLIRSRTLKNETNTPLAAYLVDVVGTIAQQGVPGQVPPKIPIRIALLSLLLLNLVLYNYYTSSVVGGLLSSPGKGPETVEEIIESPLTLSFLDVPYHKVLFREAKEPIIRELYQKKVQPSREGKHTIPVYTDIVTAVPYLKKGGYAFHCELAEAFQDIANQFDANEICELRMAEGLFHDIKLLNFILPKRSMYTEMFKTTLMRAREIGLVKRNLRKHRVEKPICQSSGRVLPVELTGVTMAFFVLAAGMVMALIIAAMELMISAATMSREKRTFLH
ncbi:ionotropic receptor 75a [Toxorhynchites rutilus septentrionalis]|uniref:ionotropic receptor 75a n=1 Tax=Toxorhynchites rutilus septentrionalis TaxID=329112 RepID=UPI00247A9D7D|nr:ionotropic receptor 75a [Toxorhynchites rutilus septentrionalis]